MSPWRILGIAATRDAREIRRAYAARLKTIDQRTEQEAFQTLRTAYEYALGLAAQAAAAEERQTERSARADTRATEDETPGRSSSASAEPTRDVSPERWHATSPAQEERHEKRIGDPEPQPERWHPKSSPAKTVVSSPQAGGEAESVGMAETSDQRDVDWARAGELVETFQQTLSTQGEAAAIKIFKTALASDELHSLQLRDMLEWRLIFTFANTRILPLDFVSMLVDVFDWRDRPDLLRTSAGPALQALLRRRDLQVKYDELQGLARGHYWPAHYHRSPLAATAAQSLLAPFSQWRCRWLALSTPFLAEMRALLTDIDLNAPEVPDAFLDAKTVDFWRKAVASPPPSLRLLGVAAAVGGIIAFNLDFDLTGGAVWGARALTLLATMLAFVGFAAARRYWQRTWGPRVRVWFARAPEATIGRILPGAVKAGLGWKQFPLALLLTPFSALMLTRISSLELLLGPLYPSAVIPIAVVSLVLFFAGFYQLKYWEPRIRSWLAMALDRSVGRILPGAVAAGLGWRHVLMSLVFGPPLGVAATLFPLDMEQSLGRLYLPVLMSMTTFGLALSFAAVYQASHLAARHWPRTGMRPGQLGTLVASGTLVGSMASIIFMADMTLTGRQMLGVMALVIVATIASMAAILFGLRYWVRTGQATFQTWLTTAWDRSVGRVFPAAVQAGLGWRHSVLALVLSPLLVLFAADVFPALELFLGRWYLGALMLLGIGLIFLFFVLIHHANYLMSRRPEIEQLRWKRALPTVLVVLVFTVIAIVDIKAGVLTLLAAALAHVISKLSWISRYLSSRLDGRRW